MKSRILVLMHSLALGGAERHSLSLMDGLSKKGVEFYLVCIKNDDQLGEDLKKINIKDYTCLNASRGFDFNAIKALRRYIDDNDINCVFSVNFFPMFNAYFATFLRRKGLKLITIDHTATPVEPTRIVEHAHAMLYRRLFATQDKILYVCKNQQRIKESLGYVNSNSTVIYNGVDVDKFSNPYSAAEISAFRESIGIASDAYVIGICAVLRPEKAHTDLVKAVSKLIKSGVECTLLIIGDGPERGRIEACIEAEGIQNHAQITGFQSDVVPFLTACNVMVLSSITENFSISALETLSVGVPMIMSDVGGARELVEHGKTGYVFEQGNIDELSTLLAEFPASGITAEACRQWVIDNFTDQLMFDSYFTLFNEFLDRPLV